MTARLKRLQRLEQSNRTPNAHDAVIDALVARCSTPPKTRNAGALVLQTLREKHK